jgi:hypothetical protein
MLRTQGMLDIGRDGAERSLDTLESTHDMGRDVISALQEQGEVRAQTHTQQPTALVRRSLSLSLCMSVFYFFPAYHILAC